MDCKTKQMSSYQRLKWEFESLYEGYKKQKETISRMQSTLWDIAQLKGADVVKAPGIALTALVPNEKE